jgi:hypothetical protein
LAKANCTFNINDDAATTDNASVGLITTCDKSIAIETVQMKFSNDPKKLVDAKWIKPFESPYKWTIA